MKKTAFNSNPNGYVFFFTLKEGVHVKSGSRMGKSEEGRFNEFPYCKKITALIKKKRKIQLRN